MKVVAEEGVGRLVLRVVEVVVDLDNLFVAVVGIVITLQRKHLISASTLFCAQRSKGAP